jgi:hypothetical protein
VTSNAAAADIFAASSAGDAKAGALVHACAAGTA